MNIHTKYMLRCIELAKNGLGTTFPNPMVGCLIVHNEKIIGEGYTSPYGGSHAEVNAINSVTDKALLATAILYVTLEPCAHHGKTPPCTDLIIEHKIPKVCIGTGDPNKKVAGKGIEKLKKTGCEVHLGVANAECRAHHKRFLTFFEKKRPYIILKWAETNDGFIAPMKDVRQGDPQPYWITNEKSRQKVHQWRSEEQAILVGTNTVMEDNPKLNVRQWYGQSPMRIILDRHLRIPHDYHVLDKSIKTMILTEVEDKSRYLGGLHYEVVDFNAPLAVQVCAILWKNNIISVIIEGGSKTLQTFIDEGLWDEARILIGANTFGNGIKAPNILVQTQKTIQLGSDTFNLYVND